MIELSHPVYFVGEGSNGMVYKTFYKGIEVAIKHVHSNAPETFLQFQKEISILSQCRHENICMFLDYTYLNGKPCLLQEYLPNGNLEEFLKSKPDSFPLTRRLKMMNGVVLGMFWLHSYPSYKIIHCDLKPSNLLLDKDYKVKVCDFGLSIIKQKGQLVSENSIIGTPFWIAPEILKKTEFDEKVDVYSFGIILWQMVMNSINPYPKLQNIEQLINEVAYNVKKPYF